MIVQKCNSNDVNKLILVAMMSLLKTINNFGTERKHKIAKKHNNQVSGTPLKLWALKGIVSYTT